MRVNGVVFSGALRGRPLISIYYFRLVGLLGFEPFKGTLDVKLNRSINITLYATKAIDHVLPDGSRMVNAQLAPANIILQKDGLEEKYACWAMQQVNGIYEKDVVELIAKHRLSEKFGLEDGNLIELEFIENTMPRKTRGGIFDSLNLQNR